MALVRADRIRETTATTGTGSVTLAGAVAKYRAWSAACVNGDNGHYLIVNRDLPEWEVGLGTWTTGGVLQRATVFASSNAGALVNFSAGTKDVSLTIPAIDSWAYPQDKVCVGIGSSVLNGYGATGNDGWFQKLGTLMVARGWTWINAAADGEGSGTQLARFQRDVLARRPSVIIIGPSLGVDGLAGSGTPEAVVQTLFQNTQKMCRMAVTSGAVPVIALMPTKDVYTATEFEWHKASCRQLAALGYPVIDFVNMLTDPTNGHYRAGYSSDGTHPNDAGYLAAYRCTSPTQIEFAATERRVPVPARTNHHLSVNDEGGAASGWVPLRCRINETRSDYDLAPRSVTVAVDVRMRQGVFHRNNALINVVLSSDATLRVRNTDSNRVLEVASTAGTALISSAIDVVLTREWHRVLLRYEHGSGVVTLMIDGNTIGTTTLAADQTCSAVTFGGRNDLSVPFEGADIRRMTMWRHGLSNDQCLADFRGEFIQGSCMVASNGYAFDHRLLVNDAVSGASVLCDIDHVSITTSDDPPRPIAHQGTWSYDLPEFETGSAPEGFAINRNLRVLNGGSGPTTTIDALDTVLSASTTAVSGDAVSLRLGFIKQAGAVNPAFAAGLYQLEFAPQFDESESSTSGASIRIKGPTVASGKTLASWYGLRFAAPPGPGTITDHRSIDVPATAGPAHILADLNTGGRYCSFQTFNLTAGGQTLNVDSTTEVILITGGTFVTDTVQLPAAPAGRVRRLLINNRSGTTITIVRNGSDTVEGSINTNLVPGISCWVISNGGTDWRVIRMTN